MLKAAIFDWDGVVVDSSQAHRKSWDLLAKEESLPMEPGSFERGFGRKNQYIIPNILGWSRDPVEIERLGNRKEELYREILQEQGLDPLPGAIELFRSLKAAGIPMAVGTSTPRANFECVVNLIGADGFFETVISAEDVTHGKPDPEVFLKGAKALDVAPADTVVFEDALYGIEAALKGGMRAVALTTTHPADYFSDTSPDLIVRNLSDITIPVLKGLWRSS